MKKSKRIFPKKQRNYWKEILFVAVVVYVVLISIILLGVKACSTLPVSEGFK